MLFITPAGAVPLAPSPLVNLPLTPSVSAEVNVQPPQTVVAPVASLDALNTKQERPTAANVPATNFSGEERARAAARTDGTLFLAQLFGADGNTQTSFISALTASSFAKAAEAYRNVLTPARQYSPSLTPARLQEFSDVKYKPGLKPPVESNRQLSLVA